MEYFDKEGNLIKPTKEEIIEMIFKEDEVNAEELGRNNESQEY